MVQHGTAVEQAIRGGGAVRVVAEEGVVGVGEGGFLVEGERPGCEKVGSLIVQKDLIVL